MLPRGAHQARLLQPHYLAPGLGVLHVSLELGGVAALDQHALQLRVHQHRPQLLVGQHLRGVSAVGSIHATQLNNLT
jgi:hypothetical protein